MRAKRISQGLEARSYTVATLLKGQGGRSLLITQSLQKRHRPQLGQRFSWGIRYAPPGSSRSSKSHLGQVDPVSIGSCRQSNRFGHEDGFSLVLPGPPWSSTLPDPSSTCPCRCPRYPQMFTSLGELSLGQGRFQLGRDCRLQVTADWL